ncbi:hypothetical protein CHO01_40190 [Cellulomonas hominis]|uniref:Uncharacterized protein n=1 Tax=Cellulomonas hominis TaxID=156981 RepID=A0A511FI54_9CELL|nr:KTSC domain-containing protein [Cellulomonas hominis]MBB5474638.1 hypothetical protein [Cellulomonas hominis]NKY06004.1 KTSC domain-containing protein [Cellulomonas hominis]GEL48903.1 hypothetical protein CHO01_40190 [Cellulomonas hominis]
MTSTTSRGAATPRVPAGVREGGRWTTPSRGESEARLSADPSQALRQRLVALAGDGFVSAVALAARQDPRTTRGIKAWWEDHFASAEYRAGEGGYPQMPDDYGTRGDGNALSGGRRTPRRLYAGGGVQLRMPAAAVVRRYAAELDGRTFDMPVTAEVPGAGASRQVTAWVRVVTRPAGGYSVATIGLDGTTGEQIAEAVSAVLESRRPSLALHEIGDLLGRRREREAGAGAPLRPVDSSWVQAVGYDEANGIMAMQTRTGALYGHEVSRVRFEQVMSAHSPGAQFNRIIKGNTRHAVTRCQTCGQFSAAEKTHTCPAAPSAPSTARIDHNAAARAVAVTATAPKRSAVQPARAEHQPAATVIARDVHDWQERRLRRRRARTGLYGPAGYTLALTGPLAAFTTSTYVPKLYRSFSVAGRTTQMHNGDSDVMRFEGLHGTSAMQIGRTLTRRQRGLRHRHGPTVGAALLATDRHPGKVEAFGYLVSAEREDERFAVGGVLVFDDAAATERGLVDLLDRYGLDAQEPPLRAERVEVPWRPGEQAWRLSW